MDAAALDGAAGGAGGRRSCTGRLVAAPIGRYIGGRGDAPQAGACPPPQPPLVLIVPVTGRTGARYKYSTNDWLSSLLRRLLSHSTNDSMTECHG